jgi:hypothetical protein
METTGRPDGERPGGCDTYYDHLVSLAFQEGEAFELDEQRCMEVDREFMQYFHRRVCWLALRQFGRAVSDADHTLALMDFSSAHAPDAHWATMHEQYRPFVLFHRTQAAALCELERSNAARAIDVIDEGLERIRRVFVDHDVEDEYEEDDLVVRLNEMKKAIAEEYDVRPSLSQQLADAIAAEHYELAAQLRDQIARRNH